MTIAIILCSPTISVSWSDTINLKSGDRLTGTLMQVSSGVVSFHTKLAGRIMVRHEEVMTLNTASFMVVALEDERVLPGKIKTDSDGFFLLSPDGKNKIALNLAEIQDIETLPSGTLPEGETPPEWIATINTGYKIRSGTKNSSGPALDIRLTHQDEKVTTSIESSFEFTEDASDADRFFSGELSVVGNSDSNLHPTLKLAAERDRNRALEYRVESSVGFTTTLPSRDSFELKGYAGVGGNIEKFSPEPLRSDLGSQNTIPADAVGQDRENLNLDLHIRYTHAIFKNSTITKELTFKPSLTNLGDLRTKVESSLTVPTAYNLHLKFDLLFDYDDAEYNNIDKWNTTISAGLRLNF